MPSLRSPIRAFLSPGLALGWAALHASEAAAQTASLVGYVLDQDSHAPLADASVSVPAEGLRARTGAGGDFVLQGLPPGTVSVRVEAPGYSVLTDEVEITAGEIAVIEFHVIRLEAILEAIVAVGEHRATGGRVRTSSAVELPGVPYEEGMTALDLLARQVPGLSAGAASGLVGVGGRVMLRGPGSITQGNEPSIYLNGLRISQGAGEGSGMTAAFRILEGIPASEVRRIQVLRGPAAGSASHASPAGVILVDTVSDGGPGAASPR
jgi:TonB-dependent starch-binding outer membrane protein SusC